MVAVGDKFETTRCGVVVVISYKGYNKVTVRFEDGREKVVSSESLQRGNISHPDYKSGLKIGDEIINGDGVSGKLVSYENAQNLSIKWEDGIITSNHRASNFKKGHIYYPNYKSVCGVGYFGIGKYKPNKSGGNKNYNDRVFASWQRMIRRCYNKKEQEKPSCRAYIGVNVCEEWHNFQNFALWAEDKLEKFNKGWELDKDMFGDGWLYSPEVCCLLPERINWFLSNEYSGKSSGLPEGVNVVKPKHPNAKVGYIARCHLNSKREYLGFYDTPEQAGEAYRKAKEGEAKRIALEYKDLLTEDQFNKLYNFKLEDIHRK